MLLCSQHFNVLPDINAQKARQIRYLARLAISQTLTCNRIAQSVLAAVFVTAPALRWVLDTFVSISSLYLYHCA